MKTREFMRYSAHGSDGASGSEGSLGRFVAHADPYPTRAVSLHGRQVTLRRKQTHHHPGTTAVAGARDRTSEAAAGEAAPHAVRAQVGEAATTDRSVGVAAGRTGSEPQREGTQRAGADAHRNLFDSYPSQAHAPRIARSSAARNAHPHAEGNCVSRNVRASYANWAKMSRRCWSTCPPVSWWSGTYARS